MKKVLKLIQVLLIIAIMAACFTNFNYVKAAEVASGTCGNGITWSLDDAGILTITGDGEMTGNTCAWIDHKDEVKSVVFNGDITYISENAFAQNTNLTSITLPSTVTEIGRRAFAECTNLKSVVFPEGLKEIGVSAFYNCTSLTSVDLGEELMYIRDSAFANCDALTTMTIDSELVLVDESATTLPENLEQINGHKYTGIYYYARQNGIKFVDIDTAEEFTGTITNQDYLDKLPTTGVEALGVISNHSTSGNINPDAVDFCDVKDETNTTYQEIKKVVEEVTADCTTDREKAQAIQKWVSSNIKYDGPSGAPATIDMIYYFFNERTAKCEGYTMITNYMLYLCGIPTATARNLTHQWSVAFVDGKWIYIDSTWGLFDNLGVKTNEIVYTYNGAAYIINELTEEAKFIENITVSAGDTECKHKNTTTHPAVASTCLVQGNNEYVTCDDCGKVVSGSSAKLPLADHNYGDLIARVEPSYENGTAIDGMKAHYKCSVCGKLFDESKKAVTAEDLVIKASTTEEEPGEDVKPGEDTTNPDDTQKPGDNKPAGEEQEPGKPGAEVQEPDKEQEPANPSEENTNDDKSENPNVPQTGDYSNMFLWVSLAIASIIGIAVFAKINTKVKISKHAK